MLSKLLKYELKATARILLPLYIVLLAYSVVHKMISVLTLNAWRAPQVISFIVYIIILVGLFVMTMILIIQRFYKNLLTDEGYLMFTLPIKSWSHIICKLIISMMWTVVSCFVGLASILIVFSREMFTDINLMSLSDFFQMFFELLDASVVLFLLECLLAFIVGLASNLLLIYASIALGHLFSRHKILASFGAFIVLSTLSQIFVAIIGVVGSRITVAFPGLSGMFHNDYAGIPALAHFGMWAVIVFFGLISAGYFFITNYVLSRHLNLE
jgi:hypothetical protein